MTRKCSKQKDDRMIERMPTHGIVFTSRDRHVLKQVQCGMGQAFKLQASGVAKQVAVE